ncbi:hypothetical protein ABZY34_26100 [Streptomyces virginiae]|uniref:hypothetical protein n=1 Tax=Streptomyces virginiae TaxID=1961 RepID=UPI0033B19D99
MELTYRRFDPSEGDALVAFLTADTWPFHGAAVVGPDQARRWVADGRFDGDDTRTFWIGDGDDILGLVRLMDLGDGTPVFDLRLRTRYRGRGIGGHALTWLTAYRCDHAARLGRRAVLTGRRARPRTAPGRRAPRAGSATGPAACRAS